MKKKAIVLALVLMFMPTMLVAGTSYYVDCSAPTDGSGSYVSPWNNIASINGHSFGTGDDVYFKVNTSCTPAARLTIDWDGTISDDLIIGAYYGNGKFGLNGNSRPIIDGNLTVPGNESGMIRYYKRGGYLTVRDLHVKNVWGYGIEVNKSGSYNTVENCFVQNTRWQAITFSQVSHGTIENNIVERASYNRTPGVGINVSGGDRETTALYNTVRGNTVYWCYEGIGVYKGARYTTVEYNTVYDNRSFHIYAANARNATFRYNLVYEGTGDFDNNPDYLVGTDCEGHNPSVIKTTGYVEIYGNLIAGGKRGIFIINNCEELPIQQKGNRIYNNTIVDCIDNFYFKNADASWSDNLIKNNISWTITAGTAHSNIYSPTGVTWSHNNFDDPVSGNAAINAKIYNPGLKKTSGWQSLTAGNVDGTEFSPLSGSKAINAGISIASYKKRIKASDFAADPIKVTTLTDSTPNIGAWMEVVGELDPPLDLVIIGSE